MIVNSNTAHIAYRGSFTLDDHLKVLKVVNINMRKHKNSHFTIIVTKKGDIIDLDMSRGVDKL